MARKLLYLEPVGGIAGDMFLAAALEVGVELEALRQGLSALPVTGYSLKAQKATRHAIVGTHLDVVVEGDQPERTLTEIRKLLAEAHGLPPRVRDRAMALFELIGRAEARVHGVSLDEVHFHEVGAVDSIVDVCGAALALELLGDPEVFSAPPPLGSGTVRTAHGPLPVPAPATLELLRDVPVRFEGVGELTTPTGAALLKGLCRVGAPPELLVERVGYGVGTRELPDRANVLRACLGTPAHGGADGTWVVEANLDDCSPQLLGGLLEQLLELGALDAYALPATMKKSRPGHLFCAIVPGALKDRVVDAILAETTTLGTRAYRVERTAVDRRFEEVDTRFGKVRIKLGLRGERVINAFPEYEDCRARAREHGQPVKVVWAEALAAYSRR